MSRSTQCHPIHSLIFPKFPTVVELFLKVLLKNFKNHWEEIWKYINVLCFKNFVVKFYIFQCLIWEIKLRLSREVFVEQIWVLWSKYIWREHYQHWMDRGRSSWNHLLHSVIFQKCYLLRLLLLLLSLTPILPNLLNVKAHGPLVLCAGIRPAYAVATKRIVVQTEFNV